MLEQKFERGKIVEVERVVKRVAAADASAMLQKQAGAGESLQRVVERLAVIGIGARIEQYFRQLKIVILSRRAVERRQTVDRRPARLRTPAASEDRSTGSDPRRPRAEISRTDAGVRETPALGTGLSARWRRAAAIAAARPVD